MIFIIALLTLSLDQFTKFLATQNLILNKSLPVIKDIFYFTLVHNWGAAFGMLKNQGIFFILTSLLAIILIYLNLKNKRSQQPLIYNLALSFILGGAIGNLLDRIFLGYVIDFLDFRIWPVFNVADSAITIGAILLGYTILRSKKA